MFVFNRIAAIFFLVLAGVAALLGVSGLPAEGLFFAFPYLLLMLAIFFAVLGSLHLLAARGFRAYASWRWVAQTIPLILLVLVLLSFWMW
jgi:hypothetical protein